MDEMKKETLLENMTVNLPVLRRARGLSQTELAELLGVARATVAVVENRKRKLSWEMYLALVLIFSKNEATEKLLYALNVYDEEVEAKLRFANE